MRGMNMKKVIFAIGLLFGVSVSLYATDISQFEIKGIKINDNYSNFEEHLNCKIINTEKLNNGLKYSYSVQCDKNVFVLLNHNKKVVKVDRTISFTYMPNWDKVVSQIIHKYGKPIKRYYYEETIDLYWGDGRVVLHKDIPHIQTIYKGLLYSIYKKSKEIDVTLVNQNLLKKNKQWAKQQNAKYKNNIQKKESNLDL